MTAVADLTQVVDTTIWEAYAAYAAAPDVEVREVDGVRSVLTGTRSDGINGGVFPTRPDVDVERACGPFRRRRLPVLWHVGPLPVDGLDEQLLETGLAFYEDEPAMVLELGERVEVEAPPGLEVVSVRDRKTLGSWVEVWTGRANERIVELRTATGLDGAATFQHLLGLLDGRPVATAAVHRGSRAAEIGHVVTHADARRRGIGAALTAAALELARETHDLAVLTASPDGDGIYRRLGFREIGRVRRYLGRPA